MNVRHMVVGAGLVLAVLHAPAMAYEDKPNDFKIRFSDDYFESAAVQKSSLK